MTFSSTHGSRFLNRPKGQCDDAEKQKKRYLKKGMNRIIYWIICRCMNLKLYLYCWFCLWLWKIDSFVTAQTNFFYFGDSQNLVVPKKLPVPQFFVFRFYFTNKKKYRSWTLETNPQLWAWWRWWGGRHPGAQHRGARHAAMVRDVISSGSLYIGAELRSTFYVQNMYN